MRPAGTIIIKVDFRYSVWVFFCTLTHAQISVAVPTPFSNDTRYTLTLVPGARLGSKEELKQEKERDKKLSHAQEEDIVYSNLFPDVRFTLI